MYEYIDVLEVHAATVIVEVKGDELDVGIVERQSIVKVGVADDLLSARLLDQVDAVNTGAINFELLVEMLGERRFVLFRGGI